MTFLDALLNSVQAGIVACDANGALTLFNRTTREFHGLPEAPLPAEGWASQLDLFRADGATLMAKEEVPLLRALRGETVRDAEVVIAPQHVPARTVLANGQPILDHAGRKIGAVVAMHDISARKQAEQAPLGAEIELGWGLGSASDLFPPGAEPRTASRASLWLPAYAPSWFKSWESSL